VAKITLVTQGNYHWKVVNIGVLRYHQPSFQWNSPGFSFPLLFLFFGQRNMEPLPLVKENKQENSLVFSCLLETLRGEGEEKGECSLVSRVFDGIKFPWCPGKDIFENYPKRKPFISFLFRKLSIDKYDIITKNRIS
jgi:hypothetical protein